MNPDSPKPAGKISSISQACLEKSKEKMETRRCANTRGSLSVTSHCWLQGTDTRLILMTPHATPERRFRNMFSQSTEQQSLNLNPGLLAPRPGPLPLGLSWSHHLLHQTSPSTPHPLPPPLSTWPRASNLEPAATRTPSKNPQAKAEGEKEAQLQFETS